MSKFPVKPGLATVAAITACTMLWAGGCLPARRASTDTELKASELAKERDRLSAELERSKQSLLRMTAETEAQAETNRYLQIELDRTREVLEYAEKQFISLERGLQSHETKASAVAALAEARLTSDKILRDDPASKGRTNVKTALEKIQKADEMLSDGRYASSVYFSRRALRLLEEPVPVKNFRIVSVSQANIRSGPGLEYDVVERVTLGTVLIELETSAPWIRVEAKDGPSGWIHESVVVSR